MSAKKPKARMRYKEYLEMLEKLLREGKYKEYMDEHTRVVRWLYNNCNKLLKVVSQKEVWVIISNMQNRIDELEAENKRLKGILSAELLESNKD